VTHILHELVEALRHELQQYGELLARLDQQQDSVLRRESAAVLDGASAIDSQAAVLGDARRRRDLARAAVARALGLPETAEFSEIVPHLPEPYPPLVRALVEENNELLVRVRTRSRQNHLLLTRTVDLMQRLLGQLFPTRPVATYSGSGAILGGGAPSRALYEAVG
jgi:hypothetical protein